MRILFSYSRDHFDPQARTNLTHGASWIARGIYEACRELGDVTYVDPSEAPLVEDKRFDLLIGPIDGFETICRRLRPRRSILFMATTHPENRNRVVKSEAKERDMPASATAPGDWAGTLSCADLILQGGGDAGLRALTRAGVERSRILNIHYGVDHVPFENERVFAKPYRFLVFATERGLGKGILRAIEVFRGLEGDYQLTSPEGSPGRITPRWWNERPGKIPEFDTPVGSKRARPNTSDFLDSTTSIYPLRWRRESKAPFWKR